VCPFILLTVFTVKSYSYPIVFDSIKVIAVIFSVFIYSKVISSIIKITQNKPLFNYILDTYFQAISCIHFTLAATKRKTCQFTPNKEY